MRTLPPLPIATPTPVLADDEDPALFHVLPALALAPDTAGGPGLRVLLVGGDGVEAAAYVDAPVELRHELEAARPAVEAWAATHRPGVRVELRAVQPADVRVRLGGPGLPAPIDRAGLAVSAPVELDAARLWAADPGLLDLTVEGDVPTRIVGVSAEVSVDVSRAWSLLRAAAPGTRSTAELRRAVWTSEAVTVRLDGLPAAPPALIDLVEARLEALLEDVLWRDGALVDDAPAGRRSFTLRAGVVTNWPWRARARVSELAPDQLTDIVTRVVLTDPGAPLEVALRVQLPSENSDPSTTGGASAEVELRAGDAHAELVVTDARTYRWRLPPGSTVAGSLPTWEWRARLRTAAGTGAWTAWSTTGAPFADIVLVTPELPRIQLALPSHVTGRAEVSIQVDGRPVERVVLDAGRRGAEVAAPAGAHLAVTWWDADGRAWQVSPRPVDGTLAVLEPPWELDRRRLLVWPSGAGWTDVARAFVDVRHTQMAGPDDEPLVTRRTIELTADGFVTVEVPARSGVPSTWDARLHVSLRDGRFRRGDWVRVPGDTFEARVDAPARRIVEVFPTLLDWSRLTRVELTLTVDGAPPANVSLTGRDRQLLTFDADSAAPVSWTARWLTSAGELRETTGVLEAGPLVLVDAGE